MNKRIIITSGIILSLLLSISVGLAANQEATELTASKLVVDDLKSQLIASGGVTLRQNNTLLKANKIIAQQDLEQVTAIGDVVFKQNNSQLKGKQLDLNYKTQTGSLTGNPRLIRDKMLITGQQFEFDLKADHLAVTGGAYLKDPTQDLTARAERINYNQDKQEVVLSGDVEVNRGSRRMIAPKVIIDLETRKITTQGKTKFIIPNKQGD
ncbi:organic solvent tolerance protein OstA [Halobacteroides halobius DSM 5150]|uniref:Organic solvent tolerance protein OstA n=1 Tax=Halobacteroides halobius (strain ATCC 35273 / DSM 5150 / MD-1) TaxID=748449 RepID=L0KAH6_HALHC|nr:LptA/OstA family protein [Halobacteroides halobius]AGB42287.1 organic solvent tolerance protein OstA [Halobacteroides halobius DSM 5150]